MRRITALLASLALLLTLVPSAALAAPSQTGTWIVTLRDNVDSATTAPGLARRHGGQVGYVYEHALNGFSFRGSQTAASALLRNPNVLAVEADAEVWLDATQSPATWGLDRIDQRNLPLSNSYTYNADGTGVTAYVIDSGIRTSHDEFDGRASVGADFVNDGQNGQDCNGHGTHVAGTIGGTTYGVARDVTLIGVRVFGCSGGSTWETIIAGINWVIQHHTSGPAVANMSLGGGGSSSVDTATNNLINDGVATAVAAGNGNWLGRQANACNYSPARVPAAMTVSATSSSDQKASWANYGDCVDWFAPGVSIVSASHSSTTGTSTKSGTSMASPHTAGVAALYLEGNPGASPAAVRTAIYDATTKGVVTSSSTSNNHLLYSGFIGGGGGSEPPPDENTPPVANDDSATTMQETAVTIDVLTNDADAEDDELTVMSATNGSSGATQVNANGTVTYTPDAQFAGEDTFTYVISDGEDTDSGTVFVTVLPSSEPPPAGDFTLQVNATKVRGVKTAELLWSGAGDATSVNVVRNGSVVASVANDGEYTETLGRGGGTYAYQVCVPGTTTCSNEVTVSY